jgi:hypothetical protein
MYPLTSEHGGNFTTPPYFCNAVNDVPWRDEPKMRTNKWDGTGGQAPFSKKHCEYEIPFPQLPASWW